MGFDVAGGPAGADDAPDLPLVKIPGAEGEDAAVDPAGADDVPNTPPTDLMALDAAAGAAPKPPTTPSVDAPRSLKPLVDALIYNPTSPFGRQVV